MSFIEIIKTRIPRTEPCGALHLTILVPDLTPSWMTY